MRNVNKQCRISNNYIKMYHKIVWCYIFVLTLLDISLNTKLSAQGKSHGVSVHDSLIEGITFQEWGSSSAGAGGPGVGGVGGGASGSGGSRGRGAPEGVSLAPPALHFGHAPLAAPHARSVTLTNVANSTLHLASVAGTTPDFHASFFESKTLAPQANTTFSVVYLGRREGPVSAHLYIHTSLGVYKYPVSAVGVSSEWRVWPLVEARVPLNASVEPLLTVHNPTEHVVQVTEVYSSGAWLGLALPDGDESAPKDLWTLPPHTTRPIVRLKLQPHHHHHHHHPLTAYVRIKANMTGGGLVVVVEARGGPAGEHLEPLHLALRVRGSRDPPDTFVLHAASTLSAPLTLDARVWSASCGSGARWTPPPPPPPPTTPHPAHPAHPTHPTHTDRANGHADAPAHNGVKSEGVHLTLLRSQLEPHQPFTKAAELTLDYAQMWSAYVEERNGGGGDGGDGEGGEGGETSQEAWCAGWARVGRAALRYAVRLLPGTLRTHPHHLHWVTASDSEEAGHERERDHEHEHERELEREREVRVYNEFPVAVHVAAAVCPPEVLELFHCWSSTPVCVGAGESASVVRVRPRVPLAGRTLTAALSIHTNLTDCRVPLLVYSGRLELEWEWPNSSDGSLRVGAVGTSSTRRVGAVVRNPGGATLCVSELSVELPGAQLSLAACAHLRPVQPVPPDHPCRCVPGGGAARAVLTVVAPARPGPVTGTARLHTHHARTTHTVTLHAHAGRLRAHALHLPAAAPYAWSAAPLVVESTMSLRMRVVNVTHHTPDPALKFLAAAEVEVTAGRHKVGDVWFMPEKLCEPHCYTGLDITTAEGSRWVGRGGCALRTDAALARARRALYASVAARNVSLHVHTDHVVQVPVTGGAHWRWPWLVWEEAGSAALAAVGAAATLSVLAHNPSTTHALLLQPVLADIHLDLTSMVEPSFCKTEKCVWSRDAFKLTEWKTIRGEARQWEGAADANVDATSSHNVTDHVMPMLILEPQAQIQIKITFSPKEPQALATYLYLRNNLTILEPVQLFGRGAYPSFEIGGRRPGNNAPLLFEVKECSSQGASVVRTVVARNTGAVPVRLRDWRLAGQPCQARGFRLQPCVSLALAPNESRALHLAFSADYTLARVPCRLTVRADILTAAPADFSLVAVAPATLLPRCHAAVTRPPFEPALRAAGTLLALAALALVLAAAAVDAERELRRSRPPRPTAATPPRAPLDLRALADEPPPSVPPAPRHKPPPAPAPAPPRRRRTPRRPPPPTDQHAERRAFERWRSEMLRTADDDDSRSSEDADTDVARTHEDMAASYESPPEPIEIDSRGTNDGYEADPETEERTPGSGDDDADSTGSTSASASSTPADDREVEEIDDRARTPVDIEPPLNSSPKIESIGRQMEHQPRGSRARREPSDTPRRADRTRVEHEAGGRVRALTGKPHVRRDKGNKRKADRGGGSPARTSPPCGTEPRGGAVRWGASWSSVVAAGPAPVAPPPVAPPPLAPIGSDVRRRAEPPASDNSLFFFNGEPHSSHPPHPPRPEPEYAWRPSPTTERTPFDSTPKDFLGCEDAVGPVGPVGTVGAVGAGAFRPLGSVWGVPEPAAWPWGTPRDAPLRPPPGFPPAPPPPTRAFDPFCSLAAIWGPAGLDWRPPHTTASPVTVPAAPAPAPATLPHLDDDDLHLELAHAHGGNN